MPRTARTLLLAVGRILCTRVCAPVVGPTHGTYLVQHQLCKVLARVHAARCTGSAVQQTLGVFGAAVSRYAHSACSY